MLLVVQGCTACYLADLYEVMQECTELLVHALALHGCAAVVLCVPAQGAAAGGSVQGKQRWVNPCRSSCARMCVLPSLSLVLAMWPMQELMTSTRSSSRTPNSSQARPAAKQRSGRRRTTLPRNVFDPFMVPLPHSIADAGCRSVHDRAPAWLERRAPCVVLRLGLQELGSEHRQKTALFLLQSAWLVVLAHNKRSHNLPSLLGTENGRVQGLVRDLLVRPYTVRGKSYPSSSAAG